MIRIIAFISVLGIVTCLCPEAFERHGGMCYKAVGLLSTWTEAKRYCNIFGADLAVIESQADEIVIEGILKRHHGSIRPENYWIDGTDILEEGKWRWMKEHGKSIPIEEYTAWSPGQPDNNGGLENCLEIRYSFGVHWNDYNCEHRQNFLCQALAEPNGGQIIG